MLTILFGVSLLDRLSDTTIQNLDATDRETNMAHLHNVTNDLIHPVLATKLYILGS